MSKSDFTTFNQNEYNRLNSPILLYRFLMMYFYLHEELLYEFYNSLVARWLNNLSDNG